MPANNMAAPATRDTFVAALKEHGVPDALIAAALPETEDQAILLDAAKRAVSAFFTSGAHKAHQDNLAGAERQKNDAQVRDIMVRTGASEGQARYARSLKLPAAVVPAAAGAAPENNVGALTPGVAAYAASLKPPG